MRAERAPASAWAEQLRARLLGFRPSDALWGWLGPTLIAIVGGFIRFWQLDRPHQLVFDETYYVKQGVSMMRYGVEMRWKGEGEKGEGGEQEQGGGGAASVHGGVLSGNSPLYPEPLLPARRDVAEVRVVQVVRAHHREARVDSAALALVDLVDGGKPRCFRPPHEDADKST